MLSLQGCSIATKRSSFAIDEKNKSPSVSKTCAVTGKDGDNIKIPLPNNSDLKFSIGYGEGPAWIGPVLLPIIPIRLSENFTALTVKLLEVPEGAKLNSCSWKVVVNDSKNPIYPHKNSSDSTTCESKRRITFDFDKPVQIDSITLYIPEVYFNGGKSQSTYVGFSARKDWRYYPIILMADQLGFPGAPYYCGQ